MNVKWPRLYDYVQSNAKGYKVKQSNVFDKVDLDQFFSEVDLKNCYQLVRAAVGIITYFGGCRVWEVILKLQVRI